MFCQVKCLPPPLGRVSFILASSNDKSLTLTISFREQFEDEESLQNSFLIYPFDLSKIRICFFTSVVFTWKNCACIQNAEKGPTSATANNSDGKSNPEIATAVSEVAQREAIRTFYCLLEYKHFYIFQSILPVFQFWRTREGEETRATLSASHTVLMFLSIVSISGYFHDSQCYNTSGPPSHLYKFLMPHFAMELLNDSLRVLLWPGNK